MDYSYLSGLVSLNFHHLFLTVMYLMFSIISKLYDICI